MVAKRLPADVAEFFRKQGSKGGKMSAAALTPEQRIARATKASKKAIAGTTPEQRRARALKAVAVRAAKRREKNQPMETSARAKNAVATVPMTPEQRLALALKAVAAHRPKRKRTAKART